MDAKEWYKSRTIMAAIAVMIMGLLSIFKIDLPPEYQGQITELLLGAGTVISGALTIWGRIRASQPIRPLVPPKDGGAVVLLCVGLSLSGCAGLLNDVVPPAPKTPQQAVFLAFGEYHIALKAVVAYESLPRCAPGGAKVCSDPDIVANLRLAQVAARATLDAAEATVRNDKFGQDILASAVAAAENAVAAFKKIKEKTEV